jgi:hypothetical protein
MNRELQTEKTQWKKSVCGRTSIKLDLENLSRGSDRDLGEEFY